MDYIKNYIKEDTLCSIDNNADNVLFYCASILIIVSIVFSYSLSVYTITYFDFNQFHFLIRQSFVGLVGITIMWFMSQINPDKYFDILGTIFFITFLFIMISMPLLPESLVTETLGARRWIKLPMVSIAPVEFFKIGFIYFLARSFNKNLLTKDKHIKGFDEFRLFIPYIILFIFLVPIIAIAQKDFGQLMLLLILTFILLMFANRSYRIFLFLGIVGIIGMTILILIAPHRLNRIFSWWSTIQDSILSVFPQSISNALRVVDFPRPYQVEHSLNAIYHGSYFGTGIGEGEIKMGFLSEVHTDFVLAGITEEIGFTGLFMVVLGVLLIIQRIIRISRKVKNPKYHLFSLGIALLISIAFLINFGGITGSIPVKGIAAPFLSYGGSSILSISFAIGLTLSISRKIPITKN